MPNPSHGDRRRQEILFAAADLSTSEGLDSLSFSRIAQEVGLTKAGVAAHFDSKEALQLAVIGLAARQYAAPLIEAAQSSSPGLPRLRALSLAWFDHLESIEFRGGCFFASAGLAFSGRPGLVRDALAEHTRSLVVVLEEQADLALRLHEVGPGCVPALLVFKIHSLAQEANLRRELLGDKDAFEHARTALRDLLIDAAPAQ